MMKSFLSIQYSEVHYVTNLSFINRHNKFDIYYWASIHIDRIQEMN
jgi:hypothetical protein